VTLGCDASVAAGPWCQLAGPLLRYAAERKGRSGWVGSVVNWVLAQ
jgi:hypothetical protein